MAGTIITDKIQTENSFLTLNVGQTLVATINSSGILNSSGGIMIGANGSVSNTAIAGVITGSQLASPLSLTGNLNFDATGTTGIRSPAANTLSFHTAGTEDMRIDATGNVGIGTSSPSHILDVSNTSATNKAFRIGQSGGSGTANATAIISNGGTGDAMLRFDYEGTNTDRARIGVTSSGQALQFYTAGNNERMRITSAGQLQIGKTSDDSAVNGAYFNPAAGGFFHFVVTNTTATSTNATLYLNRQSSDGRLIEFRQADTTEGDISVSGTTVSYNGGHLSRWAQIANGNTNTILKGTVLSNLDDMCVWVKDGEQLPNEQLNKMKVSDVEGDTNIAGVFVNWTRDEQCNTDDMNIAMTGDMIIRIAEGVTVQKGDLLMSAGDGTAKPQSDDIVRSKTIAKVTSNHVTCTYEDGSYCVPCVLMAC